MDTATLTCPECGTATQKEMPQNKSDVMYTCDGCDKQIKAKDGVCCIYCSHSDKQCDASVLKESAPAENNEGAE